MKVLVTGGAGYIGGVVTHALVEAGHQVVVLDDLSTGFADNIPAGIEFHQLSVHEVSRVLTADAGFDGVLHFAGKIEVAESVARPDLYWDVNVVGTIAVLTAMRAAGTQRLIFSSTGSMYDPAARGGRRQASRGRRRSGRTTPTRHQARGRPDAGGGVPPRSGSGPRRCATSTPRARSASWASATPRSRT